MNKNTIKLLTVAVVFVLVGVFLNTSPRFASRAEEDEILRAIADYKTWARVTKEPVKVESLVPGVPDTDFTNGVGISANG